MSSTGELRIAAINLEFGGVSDDGSAHRRDQSAEVLRNLDPHLILVQELYAPGEDQVRKHLRALANAVGMEPAALGQPRGSRRLRCGILADTRTVEILDDGPPPGRDAPFWAEAVVRIRATGTALALTSVHGPATTAAGQLTEAQRLATRTAQRGALAVAGGDWNCYTPADALTADELAALPPHLHPSRTRRDHGRITANYDVHDTLTSVGMTDPKPALAAARRHPASPPGTGSHPRAAIDRFYLWPAELIPAVTAYYQQPNPGSDHQVLMICLDVAALAATVPPGIQP